jgi:hypothetical protein
VAIEFSCRCGAELRVRDENAGRRAKCPRCAAILDIPDRPAEPIVRVETDAPLSRRSAPVEQESQALAKPKRFYRDPVVLVGAAVPTAILVAFFSYLFIKHSQEKFRADIARMKVEADEAAGRGENARALEKYQALLALAGTDDPGDEVTRASIEQARSARDRLNPIVKAEREKAEAKRRAEEEVRQAERERQERLAKEQEEEDRLAQLKGKVIGGAWSIKKAGNSDIIRGLDVFVVKAKIPKKWAIDILETIRDKIANDSSLRELQPLADALGNIPEDERLDTKALYAIVRATAGEMRLVLCHS